MKRFKRLCAVLMAASLCVMSSVAAFADEPVVASGDAQAKAAEDAAAPQVSDYKPATQSDDPNAVIATQDSLDKAAEDAAAPQVSDYKPATQSDDPNAVIATQDALNYAAQQANAAQVAVSGVSSQTFDFPNMAGQTVLHLSYGMLTVSESASDALKQAVAAWNLQNAATLTSQAASYLPDASTLNALNGSAYTISQTIKMGLNNSQYFSFLVTTSIDTGGAHPNTTCQGVTMDATTGRVLSWGDMTPYLSDFRTFVSAEVEGMLADSYGSNLLPEANSNVDSMVNNGTIPWYLDSNGMNIVLAPYTVLPYSYGVVTESISNVILQGYNIVQ